MRSLTSIRALTRVALTARPTASLALRADQANFGEGSLFSWNRGSSSPGACPTGRSLATTSLLRSAAAAARAPVVEEERFEEEEQLPPVKESAPAPKTFESIESALHAPIYRAVTER